MVSRSDTSKTIRRRTGGTGHKPRLTAKEAESGVVGSHKRTNVRDIKSGKKGKKGLINRPGDWIPNPKYKPGNPYSGEPPMIRNPERKKDKSRAKISKEAEERKLKAAKTKRRKQLVKETAAKADKGRTAREAESAKPRGVSIPRATAVTKTRLDRPVDPRTGTGMKVGPDWHKRTGTGVRVPQEGAQQPISRTAEAMQEIQRKKRANQMKPYTNMDMQQIDKMIRSGAFGDRNNMATVEPELFIEKTGGKLSRSKGGTVKKKYSHGGKIKTKKTYGGHHGSKLVAKLYD